MQDIYTRFTTLLDSYKLLNFKYQALLKKYYQIKEFYEYE